MGFPQKKIRNKATIWSNNSTSEYLSKENQNINLKKFCTSMYIAASFTVAKIQKQLKYLLIDKWIKKMQYTEKERLEYYSIFFFFFKRTYSHLGTSTFFNKRTYCHLGTSITYDNSSTGKLWGLHGGHMSCRNHYTSGSLKLCLPTWYFLFILPSRPAHCLADLVSRRKSLSVPPDSPGKSFGTLWGPKRGHFYHMQYSSVTQLTFHFYQFSRLES